MESGLDIYLWGIALFVSAILSGMEMAFVTSDRMHFMMSKKEKGLLNFILNRIYRHPRQFMSSISLGNLLALVAVSLLSIPIFFPTLSSYLALPPLALFLIIAFCIGSIIIISGEILPRAIMAHNPNVWVKILSIPVYLLYIVFLPIYKLLSLFTNTFFTSLGVIHEKSEDEIINRTEIDTYLRKGLEDISDHDDAESEVKILRNAIEFSSKRVRDCMVPRTDIVAINSDANKDTLMELFVDTGFSRVLVYKEDIDNIIGYIHVWEMFVDSDNWNDKIGKVPLVPESMQANKLMSELMQQHRSIAVVIDEFGGTSGVVTMEDLVEEIFGEIEDEFDDQTKFVKKYSDKEYVISGRAEIDTLNDEYSFGLPENDDYSTIAGMLLHYTQRIPNKNELIVIDNLTFEILKVTTRKIEVVKLILDGLD